MNTNPKIILVANSDHTFNINSYISDKDIIVRFNLPKASTLAPTGNRTDILFLANTVDIVQKKLKNHSKFIEFIQTIENQFTIIFPYSDDLIKQIKPLYKKKIFIFFNKLTPNFNNIAYLKFVKSIGNSVQVMPDHYYLDLKKEIDPNTKNILSTGIIAANFFLKNPMYQSYDIYLHGFSFEGWDGHAWDKEKNYIENLIRLNKIHLFFKP